jgi:hypothetical protein
MRCILAYLYILLGFFRKLVWVGGEDGDECGRLAIAWFLYAMEKMLMSNRLEG